MSSKKVVNHSVNSRDKEQQAAPSRRGRISLYPLDLETALGAALKTGGPPEPKKTGRATNKKR